MSYGQNVYLLLYSFLLNIPDSYRKEINAVSDERQKFPMEKKS